MTDTDAFSMSVLDSNDGETKILQNTSEIYLWGAGMVQWREHLPPISVSQARVRFPDLWIESCSEGFFMGSLVFLPPQNHETLQIGNVDVSLLNLFIYLFI